MNNDATMAIQAWFTAHDGDGEFASGMRACPYSVIGPAGAAARIIYTTKPTVVSAIIHEDEGRHGLGMVGRYGLPDEADLDWIRKVIGRQPLFFLGDMDPVDLMVFAWLRGRLGPESVTHLGLNDTFLRAMGPTSAQSLVLACAPSERESLPLLREVLPDLRETVGDECARMLERGEKIELEVISSVQEKAAATLGSLA